jgi:UDP-glucose:(heptosyl)LPS alpha-1,3-glucosyltransferase
MMKIALVSRGFSFSWGGAEHEAVKLSYALKGAGHDVHVYAERVEEYGKAEIPVTRVPAARVSLSRGYTFHKKIRRLLKGEDCDIVIGLCRFFPLDIYRATSGVHVHSMRLRNKNRLFRLIKYITCPKHLSLMWLEKKLMEPENHRFIIVNSRLVKGHLLKYFNVKDDGVRVVYNGVDHERFNPSVKRHRAGVRGELNIPRDETVALFVSNNWKLKGLNTILRALAVNEDIKLIVVGRGKKEKYLKTISKLRISRDSVIFTRPTGNVERFYGAADFFILPTQYEPCSNVCLEAMACGLPVVTTRANGASEFIAQGENGFILDDWSDHRSLSEFLVRLKDKSKREELGRRACETMKDFTWERTMREIIEVCDTVLERKKPKGYTGNTTRP